MPASSNSGRNGGSRKVNPKDAKLLENHRDACPPHKRKDLEKLVKSMNGDEDKIREKIMEWWEEPVEVPEVWEDVNKKAPKKKPGFGGDRGGGDRGGVSRGGGRTQGAGRGGRGNQGRGGGGGRGEGGRGDRPGRGGRGGRGGAPVGPPTAQVGQAAEQEKPQEVVKTDGEPAQQPHVDAPVPLSNAPFLKGAWGARAVAAAPPAAAPETPLAPVEPSRKAPQSKPADTAENLLDVGIVTHHDPTPAGIDPPVEKPIKAAVPRSGNVWATKGSAHLIQAEKPVLPPVHVAPIAPKAAEPEPPAPMAAPHPEEPTLETGLTSGLPPTTSAWGKQSAPEPARISIEMPPSPQVISMEAIPTPVSPIPVAAPQPPSPAKPVNVLNMGHWETGDGDDSQNLDFGFGSFGADNDGGDNAATPAAQMESVSASAAAAGVSPARPPPGLSIGGMPPMPANAVLVHELENKLENATLGGPAKKDQAAPIQDNMPSQPNQMPNGAQAAAHVLPGQNYNQYGMPGMYNYGAGAAGNGFGGIPAGHMLAGGMVPNQPGKPQQPAGLGQPNAGGPPGVSPGAPQGLYGSQPPSVPSSGNAGSDSADNTSAQPGMPPGMPGAIPYANPALYYGQQHQFHMGQHPQGGIGYNYGYGAQFGGVAQGGFGYQQQGMMGQHGGYGGPNYDDQGHHQQANTHHSGGSGGYQKNSGGGYRGRNAHHNNNNQYQNQNQNQYNPQQHGGYGGQPYGMGYDQYNQQRGGYGPGGMSDPYAMQQQGSGNYQSGGMGGGFQDDDQHKGKKGGGHRGNNNSSLQQNFQQGPPQQLGGQQPFGLQGQGSESTPSTGAGGAAAGGGGGWSNQGGGWSGGAPSWQGS